MTPCAALTEFEQEPLEMIDEALFEVPLPPDVRLADEVEQVRVSGGLLGEVGITRGEGVREVADRVSRSVVTSGGDVLSQDVPATPVLNRVARVPESKLRVRQLLDQSDLMSPRELCNSLFSEPTVPDRRH